MLCVMKLRTKSFLLLVHVAIVIGVASRVHSLQFDLLPSPYRSFPPTLTRARTKSSKRRAFLYHIVGGGAAVGFLFPSIQEANASSIIISKSRIDGYPIQSIDGKDWIDVLSSGQYFILRQGGTEPPNSSPLVQEKRTGVYVCAGCVTPLFDSTTKFNSNTGWPSFASSRKTNSVEILPSFGNLIGSEVRCINCGGHLGDVYNDGNKFPNTLAEISGKRFCINGAALVFVPSETNAKPVIGDGLSQRKKLLF